MAKYSKPELSALLEKELRQSLGAPGTEISRIRLRNLQYYKAEATGELSAPDIPDRSSIVSSDVADTVNWMLPALLRPFVQSQDAMECEPSRPEFSEQAKIASEYLKLLFWKRNRGFNVLHQWFMDGLIQKVGFAKVFWEEYEEDAEEHYKGLLPEQVEELLKDSDVEPVDKEASTIMVEGQPIEVFDITVKRVQKKGRCRVLGCPPEEMRVHPRSRYGEPLTFIAQQFYRTKAELEADGYDLDNVAANDGWHMEQIERASTQTPWFFDQSDGELQRYLCSECYIKLDQDDDGIPEWRKVFMIGSTVKDDEKVDDHPFVFFCPNPMPHVFFGECPADQALQPQRLRTSLMRAVADNVYLSVNQRTGIVEGQVNLDDLLNNRPGGVVRMKSLNALQPIPQGGLDQSAWQFVEWGEQWKEQRTGFTRYSQGMSADALNPTATGVSLITEKADQRMELMARVAAESVRNLFEKVMKCVCRYQSKADQVELFGQWLMIDPREWVDGFHVHINVGLGTGSKDKISAVMAQIFQMQGPLVQSGAIPPQAVILAARKFAEGAGITSPEQYFPDVQPKPPQPGPMQIEQMKAQAKAQSELQAKQMEFQLERERMQMQTEVDRNRQTVEAQQQAARAQLEMQLEQFKAEQQMVLERVKAEMNAQTQLEIARINAQAKLIGAQVSANSIATPAQDVAADQALST